MARHLAAPVLLVVNGARMGRSAAALVLRLPALRARDADLPG